MTAKLTTTTKKSIVKLVFWVTNGKQTFSALMLSDMSSCKCCSAYSSQPRKAFHFSTHKLALEQLLGISRVHLATYEANGLGSSHNWFLKPCANICLALLSYGMSAEKTLLLKYNWWTEANQKACDFPPSQKSHFLPWHISVKVATVLLARHFTVVFLFRGLFWLKLCPSGHE